MREFRTGKCIRRLVPLRSCVGKDWPDRRWVVELTAGGVRVWPYGCRAQARALSWRFIIGSALIFATRENLPRKENK